MGALSPSGCVRWDISLGIKNRKGPYCLAQMIVRITENGWRRAKEAEELRARLEVLLCLITLRSKTINRQSNRTSTSAQGILSFCFTKKPLIIIHSSLENDIT